MPLTKTKVTTLQSVRDNIKIDIYTSDASASPPSTLRLIVSLYDSAGNLVDSYDDLLSNFTSGQAQLTAVTNFINSAIQFAGTQKGYSGVP